MNSLSVMIRVIYLRSNPSVRRSYEYLFKLFITNRIFGLGSYTGVVVSPFFFLLFCRDIFWQFVQMPKRELFREWKRIVFRYLDSI